MKERYKKNLTAYEYLEGWEKVSLSEHLKNWAIRYSDRVALADEERKIT